MPSPSARASARPPAPASKALAAPLRLRVDGVEVACDGPATAPPILLMHGWPDTLRLWDGTVAALGEHHRCIRFTLPGFELTLPSRATSVARMVQLIDAVLDATCPGQRVTLLLHDWGCAFGYEYAARRPQRVARVVGVDVGDHHSAELQRALGAKGRRLVWQYQVWLALAYKIGGRTGDRMARWMAPRLRCPVPPAQIGAQMGYPYAMRWFGTAGGFKGLAPVADLACPILYVYGERKYFMFHSPEWLAKLEARPGCAVQGLPTGHWVMLNRQEAFNGCVLGWLEATAGIA
jgi:pimeloyl-ACP methyl ester carboxylesterase